MADLTGPNPDEINGLDAIDAALTAKPVVAGARASAAAPGNVSADGDAQALWSLLNGSLVVNLASGGTLVTLGQKVMSGSIPVTIASDQAASTTAASDAVAAAVAIMATGSFNYVYNGTAWDRKRSAESVSAAPNVDTGIQAVGTGPGFDRKRDPANLATALASTSVQVVNGAATCMIYTGTATTGTYLIEVTADDTNWVAASVWDAQAGAFVSGSITPQIGKTYVVPVAGWRQVRLRVTSGLGATMAHKFTLSTGLFNSMPFYLAAENGSIANVLAAADGAAGQTGLATFSQQYLFNGGSYDRQRSGGVTGMAGVSGDTASAAADAGNPVKVGGRASSGVPGAVTDAQRANAWFGLNGQQVVQMVPPTDNTLLASGARTTTQTQADQTNNGSYTGIIVYTNMTVVGTGSITVAIQFKDPASGNYVTILAGAAIATNIAQTLTIYPGMPNAANVSQSLVLPKTWRILVTANNANSATYSVGYMLLP